MGKTPSGEKIRGEKIHGEKTVGKEVVGKRPRTKNVSVTLSSIVSWIYLPLSSWILF